MARKVSSALRNAIVAQDSYDVKIFLLTLSQKGSDPIRVCSQGIQRVYEDDETVSYGVISRGNTYLQGGFSLTLSEDTDGTVPNVQISIPNAHRDIIVAIEKLDNKPITVTVELVFAENPDDVLMRLQEFDMTNISYDDDTISGTITRELLFSEPCPMHRMSPDTFPFMGW